MKVRIIGGLTKSRNFPKEPEDNTEVWGMNAIRPDFVPAWHRMFNLHSFHNLSRYRWPHIEREVRWSAQNHLVPFYTIDRWPERFHLTGWEEFPGQAMMSQMLRGSYHCSTFDWLVAFAIWLNDNPHAHFSTTSVIHEIILHGTQLNMEAGEPISGRACLEYWCGRAESDGITVTLADDAKLFDFYHLVRSNLVYGYHDTPVVEDCTVEDVSHRLASKGAPYDYEK